MVTTGKMLNASPSLLQLCLWLSFLCLLPGKTHAQSLSALMEDQSSIEIPFEKFNNFIVVTVTFNRQLPMKFILDTGARYTVLTKKELIATSRISYLRSFSVYGADRSRPFTAYLAPNIEVDINRLVRRLMPVLVMEEDYLQLEQFIGTNIHGILGMDFFKHTVLAINYQRKTITLTRPQKFNPSKHYTGIPFDFVNNKPYLKLPIMMKGDTLLSNLLIDTGADLSLLLHPNTDDSLSLPQNIVSGRIGNGLGGYLQGYIGRIDELKLPHFPFSNVVTHFQDLPLFEDELVEEYPRNGIIGSRLLSRFNVIFDFPNEILYLKPTRNYNEEFRYDRSGLFLLASGLALNDIHVETVLPNSPAEEAGILPGDFVRRINSTFKAGLSLNLTTRILQGKAGKKIRLVIERDGIRIKKVFYLRDLI